MYFVSNVYNSRYTEIDDVTWRIFCRQRNLLKLLKKKYKHIIAIWILLQLESYHLVNISLRLSKAIFVSSFWIFIEWNISIDIIFKCKIKCDDKVHLLVNTTACRFVNTFIGKLSVKCFHAWYIPKYRQFKQNAPHIDV